MPKRKPKRNQQPNNHSRGGTFPGFLLFLWACFGIFAAQAARARRYERSQKRQHLIMLVAADPLNQRNRIRIKVRHPVAAFCDVGYCRLSGNFRQPDSGLQIRNNSFMASRAWRNLLQYSHGFSKKLMRCHNQKPFRSIIWAAETDPK